MSEEAMPDWRKFFEQMFGYEAAEKMAQQMDARGISMPDSMPLFSPDTGQMNVIMNQLRQVFSTDNDSVKWGFAKDAALALVKAKENASLNAKEATEVRNALKTASLWLDPVTKMAPHLPDYQAWTPISWVENTFETWKELFEPVARTASASLADILSQRLNDRSSEELEQLKQIFSLVSNNSDASGIDTILKQMSATVFGVQIGQALAGLAEEAFCSTDIGLPLGSGNISALVENNIVKFSKDLDISHEQVRIFLALRENAVKRLYDSVPWLKAHVVAAIRDYAKDVKFNFEAMQNAIEGIDPFDQEQAMKAIDLGLFMPENTQMQSQALQRLEIVLAMVEGWVDHVSAKAAAPYLPGAIKLREMMRRRRASGGPAEAIFTKLVGLQLRPKYHRQAAALWQKIDLLAQEHDDIDAEGIWYHPDLLPSLKDLEDPADYLLRMQGKANLDETEDELSKLLDGSLGYAQGLNSGDDSQGDSEINKKNDS